MRRHAGWLLSVLMFALGAGMSPAENPERPSGPLPPTGLRCEYLPDPNAVDAARPRFSWELDHGERGQVQAAFQVMVAADPGFQGDPVWDSGRMVLSRSTQALYAGPALRGDTAYFWRVRWRDAAGRESGWSRTARFETGLLTPAEWQGRWIACRGEVRREFAVGKKVRRARAHWSGLGYGELRINGRRIGRNVLDPAWTTYDRRVLYVSFDVTDVLRPGANAAAVMLGRGWYKDRVLLFQLNIEYEDGERTSLVSDETWKTADGPVVSDSIYDGETYDARLETAGWDRPGFNDDGWTPAKAVPGPAGALSAQCLPPIRVMDTLAPRTMANPAAGVYVFDMGQNFSGWARLRVSGPAGTRVRMRFAELVYDDGRINRENLRSARAEDVYILRGEEEEEYEPRFTYHGFRYVEVTGFPGVPTLDSLRGRVVRSSVRQTGSFSCSNPLLNRIQQNILWGQASNLHGIPTDCSQRDERMGWLGDAQGTAEEALLNFDMAAFYANFVRDIRDVQDAEGRITDTVPHVWGSRPADPAWGTAYPLLVWYMYRYLGDVRTVEEQYEGLRKYVDYLRTREEDGLVAFSHYGDWVSIEPTPGAFVSAFFYLYDVEIMRDLAAVLGRTAEAKAYGLQADRIRKRIREKYYDPKSGRYAAGSQTADTLALFLDVPAKEERGRVFDRLRSDILYEHDTHLTTGIMGAKFILEVLTRYGASDLAYELASQRTYPSWGYMVENGATTLWEVWQNKTGPSMNSHNHPMFGSVGAWFYKALAGIVQAEGSVGFESIRIAPCVVRDLTHASGSIRTVRGPVSVDWSRSDAGVRVDVVIPVGSRAEVVLPVFNRRNIVLREGESIIWSDGGYRPGCSGVTQVKKGGGTLVAKIGSGRYSFMLSGE